VEVLKLSRQIENQTKEALDGRQREILLREQLRQIRKELGDEGQGAEEVAELEEAIKKAGMPPDVEEHTRKELKRLERINEASGEYSMARTYLDLLLALPWSKLDDEQIDIERSRSILDADHYGLVKIKRRILEYSRCGSSIRRAAARSCASSGLRASARRRWARASRDRWGSSSSA
jgi:ATP-dependent Lon protease